MTDTIRLADHLEISALFARLGLLLDGQRDEDITAVYDDDIVVHSPRSGDLHGIEEVRAFLKRTKVDGEFTQHFQSGVLIELDGDRAEATTNQLVHYYRPGLPPHRRSGLRATYVAVRTPNGWRFRDGRITLAWTQDV
jgi:ketosteroid isomerase-like protein